jgi:hypothetical protein
MYDPLMPDPFSGVYILLAIFSIVLVCIWIWYMYTVVGQLDRIRYLLEYTTDWIEENWEEEGKKKRRTR